MINNRLSRKTTELMIALTILNITNIQMYSCKISFCCSTECQTFESIKCFSCRSVERSSKESDCTSNTDLRDGRLYNSQSLLLDGIWTISNNQEFKPHAAWDYLSDIIAVGMKIEQHWLEHIKGKSQSAFTERFQPRRFIGAKLNSCYTLQEHVEKILRWRPFARPRWKFLLWGLRL